MDVYQFKCLLVWDIVMFFFEVFLGYYWVIVVIVIDWFIYNFNLKVVEFKFLKDWFCWVDLYFFIVLRIVFFIVQYRIYFFVYEFEKIFESEIV